MKPKHRKTINHLFRTSTVLPTAVLSVGLSLSAPVAHAVIALPDEVFVTARRTEEAVQTVPISMTVFNQEMLNERNVSSAADLVAYTPSLNVDARYGSDQASFSIRGFTQDTRTTASVAVYFADVVAPRGGGSVTAGDGAGPGSFFDLQNVQVLKGPQGTLFGRNTTGGAIQIVPQEPTNELEGYLEQSAGNHDMRRTQGVLNVPINDKLRARFGFDTQKREGYLENTSGIGPSRFADIDYLAGRASLIWEISDSLQNYTIFSHTSSENNGNVQKILGCDPTHGYGIFCGLTGSLARQGDGFYELMGETPDPVSKLKQWQGINTTTWTVDDSLTVKNILSVGHIQQDMTSTVFGSNFQLSALGFPAGTPPLSTAVAWQLHGVHTNAQDSFVEEVQFSGAALDDKLTWQAGLYYETSQPDGWSGSQSPGNFTSCNQASLGENPATWNCLNPVGIGNVQRSLAEVEYTSQAVYSQATYEINDEFKATLGLRYTVDEVDADMKQTTYAGGAIPGFDPRPFPANIACTVAGLLPSDECRFSENSKSEAPTGLIGLDYSPTPDILTYVKYSRGYRQGSIVTAAPVGFQTYEPEEVDAYEIGVKTTFHGIVPGTFNVAVFYNELADQQLQLGLTPEPGTAGSSTTAIINAGESTIQGVEVETTLKLLEPLTFNLGYTYLETHLDSLKFPDIPGWQEHPSTDEGGHLTFAPRHTVVTGLSYELPLPEEIGKVSAGANYTFTSSQNSSAISASPFSELDERQLLNLSLNWKSVFGSDFDASFFMTNALDEEYITFVSGLYNGAGAEFGVPGEPKMWGGRIKYNFN